MNNHDSVYLSLAWILLCFSFLIICFTHITYHLYDIIYHALLTQYNNQLANEPHGSMNQNYTVVQLSLFISSIYNNSVAWVFLYLPHINHTISPPPPSPVPCLTSACSLT